MTIGREREGERYRDRERVREGERDDGREGEICSYEPDGSRWSQFLLITGNGGNECKFGLVGLRIVDPHR